jgi:hypothetical protein
MTETQWLVCREPKVMLNYLRGTISQRKLRLFVCAECRQVLRLLPDEGCTQTVETAERYADGLASDEELRSACDKCGIATRRPDDPVSYAPAYAASITTNPRFVATHADLPPGTYEELDRHGVCLAVADSDNLSYWAAVATAPAAFLATQDELRAASAALLRDLVGNPFHQVCPMPCVLAAQVAAIAKAIYDERAFNRLPELADALEHADCWDQDILSHCRSEGPHVRGCWVIDLILGKS